MTEPLAGIGVVDFSRVLAGPLVAMTLGDLGADVIKIESPQGDDTRRWKPPQDAQGRAAYHHAANRNKRSVALDLKNERDLELARRLCERADVVVSNFLPEPCSGSASTTSASLRSIRESCTARSAASAKVRAPRCPATTRSCRRSRG